MQGFEGSREQEVLVAYLEEIGAAGRDRVIGAACMEAGGNSLLMESDPCLVQAAEVRRGTLPWKHWSTAPISRAVGRRFREKRPDTVVPYTFDRCYSVHGQPFLTWLKRTAAEMNGSDPATIEALTRSTDSAVQSEEVAS